MQKKNKGLFVYLMLAAFSTLSFSCLLSSCGKTTTLPAGSNVLYQVINLSPDLLPVNLYIDNTKKNSTPFYYAVASGYFSVTSVDTPYQIRSASVLVSTTNILSLNNLLKNNTRYTLFITGYLANSSVTSIFTTDTASTPSAGLGKVRFVNASIGSGGLDITANGTAAFSNQVYKNVSGYIELPAGNYDFKVYPTGVTSTLLSDLPGITVQDGKLYTLYCKGVVGRTDSAAFGSAILNNN
jgi:hypothetical protein